MSKTRVNNIEPFSADQLRILGKGVYAPKKTTVERNAILSPEDGLIIYNTDTHAIEHYNSATAAWESSDGVQSINGRIAKNQILNVGSAGLAPAVTPSGTDTNTINIPNARATDVTAGLISKAEYDSFNIRQFPVKNVVYVVKNTVLGPQDFNTIGEALDSITDASVSNPYKIEIGPGVYQESTLIMKPYVWLNGAGSDQTIISPTNPNNNIILGSLNSGISNCLISGATATAAVLHMSSVGNDQNIFYIRNCRFGNNDTHVIADSTNSRSIIFIDDCRLGGDYPFNTGFISQNAGRIVVRNTSTTSTTSPGPSDVFLVNGVGSELVVHGVQCRKGGTAGGNAVRVRDGGKFKALSLNLKNWGVGVLIENAGAAPYVQIYGIVNEQNVVDLNADHPTGDGIYTGSADHTKISINDTSPISVSITSNSTTENEVGTVVVGSTLQGDQYDRLVNLSLLNRKTSTLGVIEDTEMSFISIISGLNVQIMGGKGFLNDPTDLYLKEITWANTNLTLTPNASFYIYVDTNSVVQFSSSYPGLENNILLGRVNTHSSGIRFIEDADMAINHYGNKTEHYFRTILGPVFDSGCLVTENVTPRKLDLTAGSYHYGVNEFTVTGGSAITWEAFYRNGSGGFNSISTQDTLSNTQYDDGSGTLVSIPAGQYARHHLYLVEDKYFIVYAQETYAALADALTAALPIIPSFMSDAVVRIAGIIVQEGVTNINPAVIDIRPRLGFAAPSGTAVTDHGSLTGLGDVDDHPGYLTLNGARAMVGNLDMGGQNITNVNLVDGVDVSAHAARHLPNGADPLATAAPLTAVGGNTTNQTGTANTMARSDHQHDVATGTPSTQVPDQANAEGSSNNLARADHTHNIPTGTPVQVGTANAAGAAATFAKSDHVHNHGNQTNPAHHAVATTGANGFMSSADKTKLDTIETGATADQIASEVPYTPTGTIAANNVQDALTELDSEKVPKTTQVNAGTGLTGGGDLSTNRTISMPNVGTPSTYGSATQVPVVTTDAQGRVTGVTNTPINGVPAANITHTPTGNIAANNVQSALNELDLEKQAISEKGQANGYAPLGSDSKIPVGFLPDTVVGSVDYKGTWNAGTNTPNLGALTPDKGDYYVVNGPGSTSLGGITDWQNGDWAIYNGTVWEKVDNTDQVASVFGRQGSVTAQNGDYNAGQITNTPAGDIAAVTVQAALNELDSEKVAKTTTVSAGAGLTGGGDLSANRTISMPNTGTAGTYGAADTVPVTTTDAQGRVTGVVNTAIAILSAAVTNFAASVRGTLLTGYTVGSNVALDVADSILVAFGKIQAQLNAKANLAGGNTFTGGTQTITPTLSTDTALAVTQGRTVLGGTTPQDITGLSAIPIFQIQGLASVQMAGIQYSADTIGPVFNLLKSRGATLYSQDLVLADDEFGRIQFRGSDGSNFQAGASIRGLVDGTAAAGSMPGRLIMMTTPTGSTTPVERMRINKDGLVRVVDAFQRRRTILDFDTFATAAVTTTLTTANSSLQIITGTVAGQIVRMPDATLLTVGAEYEIRNTASVTVAIQNNAGGALDTVPAGTGTVVLILLTNGTAAGTWYARTRFEPFFQDVTATANHTVNTTGDVLVTGMTITPQAGIYDVQFDAVLSNTTSANGQTIGYGVYVDGTAQTGSDRAQTLPTLSFGTITPAGITIATGFTVTVNGSQAINIRARRGSGTVNIAGRRMKITRVG